MIRLFSYGTFFILGVTLIEAQHQQAQTRHTPSWFTQFKEDFQHENPERQKQILTAALAIKAYETDNLAVYALCFEADDFLSIIPASIQGAWGVKPKEIIKSRFRLNDNQYDSLFYCYQVNISLEDLGSLGQQASLTLWLNNRESYLKELAYSFRMAFVDQIKDAPLH